MALVVWRSWAGLLSCFAVQCEAVMLVIEWALLVVIYGRNCWRRIGLVAFVMNAANYGTGVLMAV